jgi:hypothetical protein
MNISERLWTATFALTSPSTDEDPALPIMDSPAGVEGLLDWISGLQDTSSRPEVKPGPGLIFEHRVHDASPPTKGAEKRSAPPISSSSIGRYTGEIPPAPPADRVPSLMSPALSMSTSDDSEIRTPTSPSSGNYFDETYKSESKGSLNGSQARLTQLSDIHLTASDLVEGVTNRARAVPMARQVTSSSSTLQHLVTGIMEPASLLSRHGFPKGTYRTHTAARDNALGPSMSAILPPPEASRINEAGYSREVSDSFQYQRRNFFSSRIRSHCHRKDM